MWQPPDGGGNMQAQTQSPSLPQPQPNGTADGSDGPANDAVHNGHADVRDGPAGNGVGAGRSRQDTKSFEVKIGFEMIFEVKRP